MSIGIVIFTDGRRECISRTIKSLQKAWGEHPVDEVVIIDDSVDENYASFLHENFGQYKIIHHSERRGFAGAIQSGWDQIGGHDWIFHLEDDFTFNEPINVAGMIHVLEQNPSVIQMALKRQPWGAAEIEAGGFMEMHLEAWRSENTDGYDWCWQRLFFTTNPSFYRGSLTRLGWPQQDRSEGTFGRSLAERDPEAKFGYWGHLTDPPRVHHIGDERAGTGY